MGGKEGGPGVNPSDLGGREKDEVSYRKISISITVTLAALS